ALGQVDGGHEADHVVVVGVAGEQGVAPRGVVALVGGRDAGEQVGQEGLGDLVELMDPGVDGRPQQGVDAPPGAHGVVGGLAQGGRGDAHRGVEVVGQDGDQLLGAQVGGGAQLAHGLDVLQDVGLPGAAVLPGPPGDAGRAVLVCDDVAVGKDAALMCDD